jgi:AbrB family looped-hinge helix DNA binding protein
MRITSKGQVTIPQAMRERYGLKPQTEVEFAPADGGVLICASRNRRTRFRDWVKRTRGSATVRITTDEVMRLTRGVK